MKPKIKIEAEMEHLKGAKDTLIDNFELTPPPPSSEYDYRVALQSIHQHLIRRKARFNDLRSLRVKITSKIEYEFQQEELFFYDLLEKTAEAFQKSETGEKYSDKNWNFAICDTPIQRGKGIFFGLNWGGDDIDKQSVYPPKQKDRNWNFISTSRPLFKKYFNQEIEDLNYSNLCFFRSPDMEHFQSADWELAIPLFKEYVEYINPPWMLMLGKPPSILKNNHISNPEIIVFKGETRRSFGYTAILFDKYIYGSVPHPQSQISSEARQTLWKNVSDYLMNK